MSAVASPRMHCNLGLTQPWRRTTQTEVKLHINPSGPRAMPPAYDQSDSVAASVTSDGTALISLNVWQDAVVGDVFGSTLTSLTAGSNACSTTMLCLFDLPQSGASRSNHTVPVDSVRSGSDPKRSLMLSLMHQRSHSAYGYMHLIVLTVGRVVSVLIHRSASSSDSTPA